MLASTTEETLVNSNNDVQKESSSHGTVQHPTLTLESDDLFSLLQVQYGACWGTLKFEDSIIDYSNEARPFLYVDDNIDLLVLSKFMSKEWKLEPANIVIPVLSGITNHKPFKNLKMTETLKNGIRNAANATKVWFITNGLDAGLPQLIGAALRDETSLRRTDDAWAIQMGRLPKKRKTLILIGIVCYDEIKDMIDFKSARDKSKMDVKVPTREPDQLSLNRDHTHFIIIREQPIGSSSINTFRRESLKNDSGEKQLEKLIDSPESATNKFRGRFEDFLHEETLLKQQQQPIFPVEPSSPTTDSILALFRKTNFWSEDGFPMVCTLVRGTSGTIELLYRKIQQEIPVIILKGSGSAADIIAFAYEEISAKNDKDYEDSYLKVELVRRLLEEYPALKGDNVQQNKICDHIISIVKKADQGKRKFLTFLDINSTTASLNDFHKFILSAFLRSQKAVTGNKVDVQLKRNLLLTLDWNLPDLALSQILQRDDDMKYSIPTNLFDKAVLGKKLEPFVDLFLDQEFVLHRYLTSDKLIYLFNQAKDREFLTTTSLEGILGLPGDEEEMPEAFVEHGLNIIVNRLTGISHFFSKHGMDSNAVGIYFIDGTDESIQRQRIRAERKALRHLIIYAVLMNQHQLAMILWKRSSEPIQMALICYVMFKNLAAYCHGFDERLLIEKQAKAFSDCAVGILNKSFDEDSLRALEMLDEKYPDWNDMTVIELAYLTENKEFMAHAVCQKWIIRQFYGEITTHDLSWGLFRCSDYFKIITSACLIFPMWFWIKFPEIDQALQTSKKGSNVFRWMAACFCRKHRNKNKNAVPPPPKKFDKQKPMSFIKKIQTLWNAPITKFCTTFVAYLLYLCLFTLAVLWPSCGNLLLDCFVWFWTASIVCEDARVTYNKYRFQSVLRLKRARVEIIVQTIFLALYLGIRIIGLWWFGSCQILTAKAILGIGLIYYYIRIVYIFLPISSRFGPLMIRLRHMIMDDFVTFLQLFIIFMVSSGAAITAVLYPHHPIDLDLFSKAFVFRGLMALFSSEMADLKKQNQPCSINATDKTDREYSCFRLSYGRSFKYDNLDAYNRYGISSTYCNQTSWIAWFLLIQYFFLAKRFLISLLTAMFSLTGARLQSQSEQMLIYYRYEIVMEYAKRARLPPPFVFISYINMLISNISRQCVIKLKEYSDKRNNFQRTRLPSSTNNTGGGAGGDVSSATPLIDFVAPSAASNNVNVDANRFNDDMSPASDIDRSLLGRLLNCKPCRKVTDRERDKKLVAILLVEGYQQVFRATVLLYKELPLESFDLNFRKRLLCYFYLERTIRNLEDSEANLYWKYKAKEYYAKTQGTDEVQEKLDHIRNSMVNVQKDMDVLQKSLRQNNDRIFSLEKLMIESHVPPEKHRAIIHQEDKSLPESQTFIHVLSRESPYIYTNEARFPVTEKYISWTVPWDLYDPTLITLSKEHICFQDDERPFVEPNLLKLSSTKDQSEPVVDSYITPLTSINQPDIFGSIEPSVTLLDPSGFIMPASLYKWNEIVELNLPDGKKILIDRKTWMTNPSQKMPVIYSIDTQLLIPLNPMGRTGVRGRGALIRWGPNKFIMAIITRWKRHHDQFVNVGGQRILEAMVFKDKITNDWKLPVGNILGVEPPYGALCRIFNKLAFQEDDSEHTLSLQEQGMIEYFKSFARDGDNHEQTAGFESHVVYRGYIDDVRNTDNAWVEAEIWNFHYGLNMSFPRLPNDSMVLWKDVTYNLRGFLIQPSILREIARIHDAYSE